MTGCFGNSDFDRWLERLTHEYLADTDDEDDIGDPDTAPGGHDDH